MGSTGVDEHVQFATIICGVIHETVLAFLGNIFGYFLCFEEIPIAKFKKVAQYIFLLFLCVNSYDLKLTYKILDPKPTSE